MKQSQDRNGFHVLVEEFTLPADNWNLDPKSKREVTICNLFVNHHHNIPDIARVLDENHSDVVLVLVKKGIIRDRRMRQAAPPAGFNRRTTAVSPTGTLSTATAILNSDSNESSKGVFPLEANNVRVNQEISL
jgi:hypothetical protein